ncbi:autotransporter domain-containing protein [Roseateles violae]|uniref:Autotransporter domain-containing protein n=1 Tax=Roseateles violae TaxID=3058042 RepID=A0ABT8DXM4_9BURK|nr:autotransporter domain-containing protein [Pelomonas sp. PFR6]MDN3922275.1 autotransporter domain-containing protein [Pelomonas sp. PFR6]
MRLQALGPAARLFGFSLLLTVLTTGAQAQMRSPRIDGTNLQKLANGIVGIMSYTVAPDVTTSSLSINNAATSNSALAITQFGGGFTWSKDTPIFLEGNAAYSRYDPVFVASEGGDSRALPTKWNSVSATGGIGWDFPISEHWVIRPIFNFTLGRVASDLRIAKYWLEENKNLEINFLDGGTMKATGLGGALMLDYEKFTPEHDDDLEIRYTNVDLKSHGDRGIVTGYAKAESISIWARRRIPTGWGTVWDRPVRYVLEGASTKFLGDEGEVGLKLMNSIGFGLELDSSAKEMWVTRWRAVMRYKFGPNMSGWALGLAVSF